MAMWKKRSLGEHAIDFETLEEIIEEMLETFEEEALDFSEPLKLAMSLSLDENGNIRIEEFGILNSTDKKQRRVNDEPFVELIEFEMEFLVAVETTSISLSEVDIKVIDHAIIISGQGNPGFVRKVNFPCKVKPDNVKTNHKNGVLEIRLMKQGAQKKKVAKPN